MSLTIEPKKGIRLSLKQYSAIKTWQGGGKFWEHDFQLTVRQGALQEFLPRVTDDGTAVLYEMVVGGGDVVSESVASGGKNKVPAAQIERLRRALSELKAKAEDPHCDANKRRMIEAFRLPDPIKDAELYRLYGSGRKRRLLVLWGVEKEMGSAIAPMRALDIMPAEAGGIVWTKWLWILLPLLIVAAAALLLRSCGGENHFENEAVTVDERSSKKRESEESPRPLDLPKVFGSQSLTVGRTNLLGVNRPEPTPQVSPTNTSGSMTMQVVSQQQPNASPKLALSNLNDAGQKVTAVDRNTNLPMPASTTNDSTGPSSNSLGKCFNDAKNNATDQNAASPKPSQDPVDASSSKELAQMPKEGSSPAQSSPSPQPEPKDNNSRPDAVIHDVIPVATGGASRIKITAIPEGESVTDQVTVLLTAAGQNDAGALVSRDFSVKKWIVDRVEQLSDGQPLRESTLPITLKKGMHRVRVEGTTGSRTINAEVDLDVTLKQTTQSAVTVLPAK